jgi:hypothetical protein
MKPPSPRKAAILRGEAVPGLTPEQVARHAAHYRSFAHEKSELLRPRPQEDASLAGNRVAGLAKWLGFDPCSGCEDRRQWLNKAHRWLRTGWAKLTAHGTMAIVTCHFNPGGYPRLAENYRIFRDALGSLPLYTAEASFDGTFISDGPVQLAATAANILWQKERLLNLVVAALPAKYDRVAWLDADVIFRRPDWYEAASQLLDRFPVVQLAESVVTNGRDWNMAAAIGFEQPCKYGYAWAARRELFPLYDAAVIGGGDWLNAAGWRGVRCTNLTPSPAWQAHYDRWAAEAKRKAGGKIGCLAGEIFHLDHGTHKSRQYNERYNLVRGLDPDRDLESDDSGLWRWTSGHYMHAVRGFFDRRQDG